MTPTIITHAASVIAQNKKDRTLALGKGTHSKSKSDILHQQILHAVPPKCRYTFVEAVEHSAKQSYARLCCTLSEKPQQTAAWQLQKKLPHLRTSSIGLISSKLLKKKTANSRLLLFI